MTVGIMGGDRGALQNASNRPAVAGITGATIEEVMYDGRVVKVRVITPPKAAGLARGILVIEATAFAVVVYRYGVKGAIETYLDQYDAYITAVTGVDPNFCSRQPWRCQG